MGGLCEGIPSVLNSFVDTFVDYTVSGFFLLPKGEEEVRWRYPGVGRVVAIGDLHGDIHKARESFRAASLIDASDRWIGGSTTVVQIGDLLDRGSHELRLLYLFEKLSRDAARSGGTIISLNGNHEIMNLDRDFRYVTPGALREFRDWAWWYQVGNRIKTHAPEHIFKGIPHSFPGVKQEFWSDFRVRIAALRPSGPIARRFLGHNATAVVIGETVFVHGGLLREHVAYGLERMNSEVRDWIVSGDTAGGIGIGYCRGKKAVVWLRSFSHESARNCDCETLRHVLETIPGARRMVMGHTIQQLGINSVCQGQAIRIDVGMSKGCIDALPQVLEIISDNKLTILTATPNPPPPSLHQHQRPVDINA